MSIETGVHYPLNVDDLPEGWRAAHFGEFTERIEPGYASGEHNQTGAGIPHLRPMNIDRGGRIDLSLVKSVDAAKDKRRLAVGDVLFNNTNSPELVGKTAVISQRGEFAFSNHMTRIQMKESVLPKFAALQFHLLWMRGYFKYNCVKHVNQASISSKTLAQSVPFIWAPLVQQAVIVAELERQFSRLDEAVANLQRVKANLKRYKASVLKAAVEGRLVETEAALARREGRTYETGEKLLHQILVERRVKWLGKGKYKEPEATNVPGLRELPEGWTWASAVQACEQVVDCHNKTAPYTSKGIPLVRTTNIKDGRLLLDDTRYVDQATYEFWSRRCPPEPGDVLFTREAPMGEAGIIPPGVKLCLGQRTMLMRPSPAISSSFLLSALLSPVVKDLIDRVAVGSGVKHLRVGDVERLPVPLPPVAEQTRIVAEVDRHLSIIREVEAEVDTNLKRAQALRQATLARAFSVEG